nr:hypothetical protein [Tanacetum cinerariifolium]
MSGSGNENDDASVHNETTNTQQQPNIQPQIITTVSNNNAKFPYLKKDEVIILPPMTAEEHIAVQRESKARTTLLYSIHADHMRKSMLKQEFLEFIIGEAKGLHKGYDRMQKILSQLNQLKAKPVDEDINLKFLRALPSSWSQVALTLKIKGGLKLLSFDDLYYKLKTLEVDVKGYTTFPSSQSAGTSHYAFKARRKLDFDNKEFARFNKKKEESKALITVDTLVDWTDHDGESDGVIASNEFGDAREFALMGVISEVHNCPLGCDNKCNELHKQYNELNEQNGEYFIQVQAYKNSLKTLEKQKNVLQRNQLTLEDKIRVLSIELENTSNPLKHAERINDDVETAKKDL